MRLERKALAAGLGGVAAAVYLAASGYAKPPQPLVVGHNPATCKGQQYTSINDAVAHAPSGATIKVCAGTYDENVMVTEPLTFQGAQAGKDARHGRNDASKESTVSDTAGDGFTIQSDDVTIDGFTIAGVNTSTVYDGIRAFGGTSGLTVVNNIVTDNCNGMNLQNPDGNKPALIKHNLFSNNTANGSTADCGTAIFISNGPANNTSIDENAFSGQNSGQTAINTPGALAASPSVGLSITNNKSTDDSTFVVIDYTTGAVIANNDIEVPAPDPNQGTGILDYGSNTNLLIESNTINGGAGSGTSGINVRALTGTPSVNTTVANNHVMNRWNGIRVTDGATSAVIHDNHISNSQNDGIFMQSGYANTFMNNHVDHSQTHDCEDDTTGSGTAGTANTWKGNHGSSNNSSPAAICGK